METPVQTAQIPAWEAPEHPKHIRDQRWYISAGIVVLLCATYGILTHAWSFAIVSVITGALYALVHDEEPTKHRCEIVETGILWNGTLLRWEDLQGFWMHVLPTHTALHLVRAAAQNRDLIIQIPEGTERDLRLTLGAHIPELANHHEGLMETVIRICKL